MHTLSIIGAGQMGSAIAKGLIKSGKYKANEICLFDLRAEHLAVLNKEYGFTTASSIEEACKNLSETGTLIIAVKPQNINELLENISSISKEVTIVSIAAGTQIKTFEAKFPKNPVIRVMPNTPAQIMKAASVLAPNSKCNAAQIQNCKEIFESIGLALVLTEDKLDAVTALSGSGPAYVFLMIEAMTEAGVKLGLDEASAKALARETVYGAASLVKESGEEASELRKKVTSPNGTTQAGLESFASNDFNGIVAKALKAAHDRSIELAQN